jgi:hypothetical protein
MTDIESELLKLISDLRAENAALTEVVLTQSGLIDEKVIVPESIQGIGKEPWYIKKKKLERLCSVNTRTEVQDIGAKEDAC